MASIPDGFEASPRTQRLRLAYGDRLVVEDLDVELPAGAVTVVIGPNACGKSTLLRALARLLRPRAGFVYLGDEPLSDLAPRALAQRLALLPQSPVAPEGITVRGLVARGRTPYQRWWRQWSNIDERAVATALTATAMEDVADRRLDALSGGQRQRAWLALVLAQDTRLLLLDEPTTHLDLAHQVEVLRLVSALNRDEGRTVVIVLHDLNQACRYAHNLVAMREGRVVASGAPEEIVTATLVAEVFGMPARVLPCPVTGAPLVVPERGHGERTHQARMY